MITKKIAVEKIRGGTAGEIVEKTLKEDPKNAYTVMGIMVEKFGVKETAISNIPFNQWEKGLPTLYTQIKSTLERLVLQGKVKKQKVKRAWLYWWA